MNSIQGAHGQKSLCLIGRNSDELPHSDLPQHHHAFYKKGGSPPTATLPPIKYLINLDQRMVRRGADDSQEPFPQEKSAPAIARCPKVGQVAENDTLLKAVKKEAARRKRTGRRR
ncbi:hypothetical protein RTCIAT899_CH04405 [Rhizobium tropici CIAT 899]|nr:hypothetical protein RTCIAT899_CH04405 [Rhizobium tropici CIAT 899]